MKLRYTLLLLMMIPALLWGQKNDDALIYGKVMDDNNNVIELVNIAVMGTSQGTSSNARGQYELKLPANVDLEVVFSFIGYQQETVKLKLKEGEKRKIDVVMNSTTTMLPETVVSAAS